MNKYFRSKSISLVLIFIFFNFEINLLIADEFSDSAKKDSEQQKSTNPGTVQSAAGELRPFTAGDGIFIDTFPDTSSFLSGEFAIDGEGMVDFPFIGKVKVTELSQTDLENLLKNQFKAFLKSTNLRVKPLIRVSVIGGVLKPGLFYIDNKSTLWDAIKKAGGPTHEKGFEKMTWQRNKHKMVSNLVPLIENGYSLSKIGFRSGDLLVTPREVPKTFMQTFLQDVVPTLSFVTGLFVLYWNYSIQTQIIQSGRFNR